MMDRYQPVVCCGRCYHATKSVLGITKTGIGGENIILEIFDRHIARGAIISWRAERLPVL